MDKPKLRLKEQPPSENTAMDWVQKRYAQPKPPSALQRLGEGAKRYGRMILLVAVALSAFLVIPFRSKDDYVIWRQIQDALVHLEEQPDSLPHLKQVIAAAQDAGLLWNQPSGTRPEKWYQYVQRNRYDACYEIIQVLALGSIKQGAVSRGISELDRLKERTGLSSLPDLPSTDQAIRTCTRCKNGKIEEKCLACDGKGSCKRCDGQGSVTVPAAKSAFPLTAKLGGTGGNASHAVKKHGEDPVIVHHNCPVCQGSGKCKTCAGAGNRTFTCQTCGGHFTIIDFAADPNMFQNTVKVTIATINKNRLLRRAIHIAANVQRAFLRESEKVSNRALSLVQGDPVSKSTNPDDPLRPPLRTNDFVAVAGDVAHSGMAAAHADAAPKLSEERLQQACVTLRQEPLSVPDLVVLTEISRFATNSPALRSRAMAAYALALLMQGNTNAFARAAQMQKTVFPELPPLLTITPEDYTATCDVCKGIGMKDTPCPSCMGPRTCKACNGTGKQAAGDGFVRCRACELRGTCGMCNGQQSLSTTCPTCKGVGTLLKQSGNVRNNYNALLTDMAAICQENIDFAARSNKARR